MTNPMIEAAARAIARRTSPRSSDLEIDEMWESFFSGDAQAAITAIEPMIRAQVEREIVEWLRGIKGRLPWTADFADFADDIEAGEHRAAATTPTAPWCGMATCGRGVIVGRETGDMVYDKRKLQSPLTPWLDHERLHQKNMRLGSTRLYEALLREHPRIVMVLQHKNKVTVIQEYDHADEPR